jgi:hypothetical protein
MKKTVIVLLMVLFSSPSFGQINKLIAEDGWWIDYDNFKSVKIGMSFEDGQRFLGEPRKIISIYKNEKGEVIEVYTYSVKIKSIKNVIGKKPQLFLQSKPAFLWGEEYLVQVHIKNGIIFKISSDDVLLKE